MAKKRSKRSTGKSKPVRTLGRAGLRTQGLPEQVMLSDDACVYVRSCTAGEAVAVKTMARDFAEMDPDSVEASNFVRWKMIQLCACELDGTRIYDDSDDCLAEIKLLPVKTVTQISDAAMVKNGMARSDVERLSGE